MRVNGSDFNRTKRGVKKMVTVITTDNEMEDFDTLKEAEEYILSCYCTKDEGIHPDIESNRIIQDIRKIEVLENEDKTHTVNFVPVENFVIPKIAELTKQEERYLLKLVQADRRKAENKVSSTDYLTKIYGVIDKLGGKR